jgi:hypothetical protein
MRAGWRALREELMDTQACAAPDEKTTLTEEALATQLSKDNSSRPDQPEICAAVARLTSNSIDELRKLVSELQKMQEFLKSEVDNVQRQIDSAVAGINIIVETIGPWKSIAGSSGTRNVRAGGPAANIEQRIRGG